MGTTISTIAKWCKKPTTFLDLPPELRQIVYKYGLKRLHRSRRVVSLTYALCRYTFTKPVFLGCAYASKAVQRRNAGILLACRTTYLEAIDLYYAHTTFKYSSTQHLRPFLQTIFIQHRNAIPEILRPQSDDTDDHTRDRTLGAELFHLGDLEQEMRRVMKTHYRVDGEEVWREVSSAAFQYEHERKESLKGSSRTSV